MRKLAKGREKNHQRELEKIIYKGHTGQLFPTDETGKSQFRCLVRAVFSIYNL